MSSGSSSPAPAPPTFACEYKSCEGCRLSLRLTLKMLEDEQNTVDFLFAHGALACHVRCSKCKNILKYNLKSKNFRCRRVNKKSKRCCNTKISMFHETFFSQACLPFTTIVRIVHLYLSRPPPRLNYIQEETEVARNTLVDWFNFTREVFIYWADKASEMIGGEGQIVEIDEAKVGKRKFNRGRILEGQWIFGGIERGTKRFFIVAVEDRSADTLMAIIRSKIRPGSTIYSDCWRGYDRLGADNYTHLTVNHSLNFVDPQTGVHTQNIERTWVEVKKLLPRFGRRKKHYPGYLAECLFMMRHKKIRERSHEFWQIVGELYPGIPHPEDE